MNKVTFLSGASLAALFSLSNVASAQEASPETPAAEQAKDDGIGDIVVTAQRREESAQKISVSVTVLGGDTLRDTVTTTADLAKLVPNVQLETPFGLAIPNTSIRGISQSDFNATATTSNMIYIDEIPMNSPLAQGVPIWDLARAEVLRGPQGTLFGRNATGGAIRYIVQTPGNSAEGYVDATFGTYGHREVRLAYGGPITDRLGARISAMTSSREGEFFNITRDQKQGERQTYGIRAVVMWQPVDALEIALRAQYFKSDQDVMVWKSTPGLATRPGFTVNANGFTSIAQIQAAYGFTNAGEASNFKLTELDVDPNEHIEHIPLALNMDLDLGNVTLTSASGFLRVNQSLLVDIDSTPAPILNEYDKAKVTQWTQEIRLTSDYTGPFNWIAGAFYMKEKVDNNLNFQSTENSGNNTALYPNASTVMYRRGINQTTESYAFFAHTTYELAPELKLTAAARWTKETKDVTYRFRSWHSFPSVAPRTSAEVFDFIKAVDSGNYGTLLAAAPAPASDKHSWEKLTWKLGLDYQVTPDTLVYGFVSRGFKGGSFPPAANTRAQVVLADGSLRSVDPETVTDYEVGVKSDIIPNRLRVNFGAFYYDYRGYQTNQFFQATQILSNLPKAEAYGAELEVNWRPVTGLHINLGGAILKTKILKALDPRLEGNKLPLAQSSNFNGSIGYRIETGIGAFTPEISGKYRGHFYQTKENTRRLGGQATFDARIGFESPGEKFYGSLWVRNLTNKIFPVIVSDDTEFFGSDLALLNERRSAGVTFGIKF